VEQDSSGDALPYRGLRTTDYLYVEYPTDEFELYDLRSDPYQLENLVPGADPALVASLASRVDELAAASGADCRVLEDAPLGVSVATAPEATRTAPSGDAAIYYLGYATQENVSWIEQFDADVLTRAFLLFLNSSDGWVSEYGPRLRAFQEAGRKCLVGLQAAVLVEHGRDLPRLGTDDPALEYATEAIPNWREYACRTSQGQTLDEAIHVGFAHACLNNAQFREFLQQKLRAIVDSGADGVHIDELPTRYFTRQEGYCDACIGGFREYLASRYVASDLRSVYGIADVATFDFRKRLAEEGNLATPPSSSLHPEWWLYQLTALVAAEGEVFSQAKAYAAQRGGEFLVNANSYEPEENPDRLVEMTLVDLVTLGTGMTISLRQGGKHVSELRVPPAYSYLPLYRLAQALTPDKPVTLFIDGPGGTSRMAGLPDQQQEAIVEWMFAEACAAGAHFHVPYPSLDYYGPLDVCKTYATYVRNTQQRHEESVPQSTVGVLFSYASEVWDFWLEASSPDPNHNRQWYGLCQALTDLSVQYDVVFAPDGFLLDDSLTLEHLARYPIVIVPWAYALRDEHVLLLDEYARGGGQLIIFGDLGTVDERKHPRTPAPIARYPALRDATAVEIDFETYLNDPGSRDAGGIRHDLSELLPPAQVTVIGAPVAALLSQARDTLWCHLINKDLRESGFRPQDGIKVVVALPEGFSGVNLRATWQSPELNGEAIDVPIVEAGDSIELTVPQLDVYGALAIWGEDAR
jgi:hypothetical protein